MIKRILSALIVLLFLFTIYGCNSNTDELVNKKIEEINNLVDTFPQELTIKDENLIASVRNKYDALTKEEKALFTKYETLVEAEEIIKNLKSQKKVADFNNLVNSFPQELTIGDEDLVVSARNKYDVLTEEEKSLVSNYDKLVEAEQMIKSLKNQITEIIIAGKTQVEFGKIEKYSYFYNPNNAVDTVTWSTSDTNIATIDENGLLTAVGIGYVDIIATADNNVSKRLKVKIYAEPIDEILYWIHQNYDNLVVDKDIDLPTSHPRYPNSSIEWLSFDDDIFTSDGKYFAPILDTNIDILCIIGINGEESELDVPFIIKGEYTEIQAIEISIDELIPANISNNIILPSTHRDLGGEITWKSSNEEAFSSIGNYYLLDEDTPITIDYKITLNGEELSGTLSRVVLGKTDLRKAMDVVEEFDEIYANIGEVSNNIELLTTYEKFNPIISWRSDNEGVISSNGTFTTPLYTQKVNLYLTVEVNDQTATAIYTVYVNGFQYTDTWEAIDVFLDNIYRENISNQIFYLYGFEAGYEKFETINKGYIPFYNPNESNIIDGIVDQSKTNVRSNTLKTSTDYITIHNTGSAAPTATAKQMNSYINNIGPDDGYKSWHFTVDDNEIYQHVPIDEVAWHASDGSARFGLNKTNIKATSIFANPVVTISVDGYYQLDGVKSNIKAPLIDGRIAKTTEIVKTGIHTEIGEDGYYYIGNSYVNSEYKLIANAGGNRNSVGIEMAVYAGIDFNDAMRNTAKLTSELLVHYGLDVNRIKQHYDFSGKNCPQVLREGNRWEEFLNLVRLEFFAKHNLEGVSFTWESLTPNIMDNEGRIFNHPGNAAIVEYKVTVEYNGVVKEYNYTSNLLPLIQ